MRRLKYILLLGLGFGLMQGHAQQTVQFSQYVFNGLAVNPAYAGYKADWTLNLNSRLQWVGINGAPKTNTFSIDGLTNAESGNVGLGLLVSSDVLGPESNNSAYINYAYRLRLDENDTKRLCFGIGAGLVQYNLDASKFNASDVSDGLIPTGDQSRLTPDFRLGLYYYSPSVYVGASVLSLLPAGVTTSSTAVIQQVRHYYLTGGVIVPLSGFLDWKQ